MNRTIPMNRLQAGQIGYVQEISLTGVMRRRLLDMGLHTGTKVECCMKSPGGDPAAYFFCGTLLALRTRDAARIRVRTQ